MRETIGLNLSHILEQQNLSLSRPLIDMTDISGTDCYCDDYAKEEIRTRLAAAGISYPGIHYIDSGNYHYLTLFFLEKIPQDLSYELIVFDNHPDSQPPAFGDITSCGGWVLEAEQRFENIKRISLTGVDPTLTEIEKLTKTKEAEDLRLPVYISIDKDVLSEEYASCNWSQGRMSLLELGDRLQEIIKTRRVLGVDICGEEAYLRKTPEGAKNERANIYLKQQFSSVDFLI